MRLLLLTFFSLILAFSILFTNTQADNSIAVHPQNRLTEISGEELMYVLEGRAEVIQGVETKIVIVLYGKDSILLDSVVREISVLPPHLLKRKIEEKIARGQLEQVDVKQTIMETYREVMADKNAIAFSNSDTEGLADIIGLKIIPIVIN
tara:strand:- start:224 stop:673 length:450 start_codon:yes stop_codon:yes gene_type:complete